MTAPDDGPRGWVDAHTHLDLPAFDADRAEVWARARGLGVTGAVVCASDPAAWDRTTEVATQLGLPWTLGVHPWWCASLTDDEHAALLDALRRRPTPHGVGETGLDHGRATDAAARERQRLSLSAHLALARSRDVPVVLHLVRALEPARRLLRADGLPSRGGMVHSWSGDPSLVPAFLDLGLYLSFSAAFTRSPRLAEALRRVPAARLLLETDCPDQALAPGTRGEPADLVALARAAAEHRGEAPGWLLDRCAENAAALFPSLARPRAPEPHHRAREPRMS